MGGSNSPPQDQELHTLPAGPARRPEMGKDFNSHQQIEFILYLILLVILD